MSLRLQEHGFPTLNVVAALKRRREALNWIGLLVAEEVESVSELPSAGQHVFQIHPPINLSEELAGALGRYLASLHAAGFYHGDLKTRHILVADRADGFTFHLVDLEKSLYLPRLLSPLKLILASRDLVQLSASLPGADPKESKADLVLESYLEAARLSSGQRRTLKKLTALYGKHGAFRQGRTLLENLVDLFKRR